VATSRGGPESDPACHTEDTGGTGSDDTGDDTGSGTGGSGTGGTGDGEVVGFALWYLTFSTWTGRPGIHLEDLFVRPTYRRAGYGRALLAGLAALCAERGYSRLEWSVLDWNTSAQAFYRTLGAAPTAGWDRWRLDGDGLTRLARFAGPVDPGGTSRNRPF
jgi:GNAT superfamily N-acetyltransferase